LGQKIETLIPDRALLDGVAFLCFKGSYGMAAFAAFPPFASRPGRASYGRLPPIIKAASAKLSVAGNGKSAVEQTSNITKVSGTMLSRNN